MQFRPVAKKVQCLVSVYDAETKRTRQKMVYSFDQTVQDPSNEKRQVTPDLSGLKPEHLSTGTNEQRAVWVAEIRAHAEAMEAERQAEEDADLCSGLVERLDRASHLITAKPEMFSGGDLKSLRAALARLSKAMDTRSGKTVNKTSKRKR
jgi:hypothetical protein